MSVSRWWVLVFMGSAWNVVASEVLKFPAPPRIATTVEELAARKAAPDFATVLAEALVKAEAALANPPELPAGNGGWTFDYACPKDAAQMRPLSLLEHECSRCQTHYTNRLVVLAYRCRLHYAAEHAAVALSWAYAYTGEEKYVPGVKRVLLKLADDYASYPDRMDRWGKTGSLAPLGGRRYVQSLDEAVGAIYLAKAYDLTRSSPAWTAAERKHVEQDFFRPTAESLLRFTQQSNHQTWYNAGLIAIAATLADAELLTRVIKMPRGVLDQLEHNIGRNGLWYEGAMVYHNYALAPLLDTADMTRRLGLNIHVHPKLRAMIAGPLRAAYPDGSFPAINDSDPASVAMFTGAFKWAWQNWRDPFFAQAHARGNVTQLRELLGPDAVVAWPLELRSEVLDDAGLVVLRAGDACVFVDYGAHGGEHGHPDKLNIMVYALGRELILDPGRITYSVPEYKTWARTTVAHNTVVIGGQDQAETTGELWHFGATNGVSGCLTASAGAYPGSLLKRFVALTDRLLVDVFTVEGPKAVQLDWLVHCRGTLSTEVALKPAETPLGTTNGYQHLREVQTGAAPASRFDFAQPSGKQLQIHFVDDTDTTLFSGTGIGYRLNDSVSFLLRRRQATTTTFVTVYDLTGDGSAARKIERLPDADVVRLRIQGATKTVTVEFDLRKDTSKERLIWHERDN